MSNEGRELLTREDFLDPRDDYFACEKCHIDTFNVVRHEERQYLATFQCENAACPGFLSTWCKCRVCCRKNKRLSRLSEHLKSAGHKNQVSAFEETKSKPYTDYEKRFVAKDGCENATGSEGFNMTNSNDNACTLEPNDESSLSCNNEMGNDSSPLGDDYTLNHDQETADDEPTPPANQTIEEWKQEFISKSREPSIDFSKYFPTLDEEPPNNECSNKPKRTPMNREYFQSNVTSGHGSRVLYGRTILGMEDPETIEEIRPDTVTWCMILAMLSDGLTTMKQKMLVALLSHAREDQSMSLPSLESHAQLRKMFIDGRDSIPHRLPRPIIQRLDNGFVYVPIRDILQYHMANGQSLEPLVPLAHSKGGTSLQLHGSSPRGMKLIGSFSTDFFPCEVLIWSDAFDANDNKNNRGSTQVIFASIGTPQDDYHSGCNTYPVAIGPANTKDWATIVDPIVADLTELFDKAPEHNVFLDGSAAKEYSVFLRVYCLLQDRPERCQWLFISYGNGKYAARFGWAGDAGQEAAYGILPSCSKCQKMRMSNTHSEVCNCEDCSDWQMEILFYDPPEDYPKVFKEKSGSDTNHTPSLPDNAPADPRENGSLRFRKLSVKDLKSAVDSTFSMVRHENGWKKKEGVAFLQTFALKPEYINKVCDAADGSDPQPPYPSTWEIPGVDICDHIDVPMHLCFLGITKANSADLIKGWLKSHRKSKSFGEKTIKMLTKIKKLSLSWCRAETTFGGYVSENWVAYCRLFKYLHQVLSKLKATDELYRDPTAVPLSQYTLPQKRAWLIAREVDSIDTKSKRETVEDKFKLYVSLPAEQRPKIVEPVKSKATTKEVEHMVACWQVCMSRLMAVTENPSSQCVADIDRHIKLFLTAVEQFDVTRRENNVAKNKKAPVWRVKPNYLGLLNLPSIIREMGPIRMLSELDFKGEASIKHIKRHINNGHTGDWAYNAMLGFYREKSLKYVLKDCVIDARRESCDTSKILMDTASEIAGKALPRDEEDTEDDIAASGTKYHQYRAFKDEASAVESLLGDDVVSGVIRNGRFYLVAKSGRGATEKCFEIKPAQYKKRVCGADYFTYERVAPIVNGTIEEKDSLSEFFLLLPLVDPDGNNSDGWFYLITSGWREVVSKLSGNGFTLQSPEVPNATYN